MAVNIYALIVLIAIALLLLTIKLSAYLMKRAVHQVIRRFYNNLAIRPQLAVPLEELGLSSSPKIFGIGLRDYKPYAIQLLKRFDIIQITIDGRYFLSEEKLRQNPTIPRPPKIQSQIST